MIKLFRDKKSNQVKEILTDFEGKSYKTHPMDFFITLARYKFASRFLKKEHSVIDIGCGRGFGSVFLSDFCNHVIGADNDTDMIAFNSNEHKDVKNLKFKTVDLRCVDSSHVNKYDVVVSMDVIEHFEREEVNSVIRSHCDMIGDGGFAVIGTPNIASLEYASYQRINTHPFEFSPEEFEEKLNKVFKNVFVFSMTDESVSTQFVKMSWYLMALCTLYD